MRAPRTPHTPSIRTAGPAPWTTCCSPRATALLPAVRRGHGLRPGAATEHPRDRAGRRAAAAACRHGGRACPPRRPGVPGARVALFGEDLTGVDVRLGSAGAGALGVARGESVTVPAGTDVSDPDDLALLAHEFAHVLQQRKGRVDPANPDPSLELEAEALGQKVAAGQRVTVPSGDHGRTATPQYFRRRTGSALGSTTTRRSRRG
ncbi:MAG: DUF4157 domain-containing protein [Myxococcota bacterium]